jgi:predicted alpha/beta superfamily hydrolase
MESMTTRCRSPLRRIREGAGAFLGTLAVVGLLACAQSHPGEQADGRPDASAAPQVSAQPSNKPEPASGPARVTLHSTAVGEQRSMLVRTPPGYERGSDRYPVLYLTDGDRHIGHTSATVEYLAERGRMPEMIIVGISNTDRTRDLTPTKASLKEDGKVMELPTSGGADKFLEFIEKELIPHVEKTYRTQPYRVFAGHSFGGLFAVHALVTKPDLFHALISAAPSLHWDNALVVNRAEQLLTGRPELGRTLFVTLGDEPGEPQAAFERCNESPPTSHRRVSSSVRST